MLKENYSAIVIVINMGTIHWNACLSILLLNMWSLVLWKHNDKTQFLILL